MTTENILRLCLVASLGFSGFSCVLQTNRDGANAGLEAFAGDQSIGAEQESELAIDTESLDRMEKVADAYRRKALYSEAEAIIQDVFEIRRKKRGAEDAEMAYYHNNLGLLQAEQ
ncbi:MAG TPA: hypothetical protein VHM64_10430, partial [Candidatus Binatia bacterium]|nr:hypothetical protein [Candidatus Binatia bacterium]